MALESAASTSFFELNSIMTFPGPSALAPNSLSSARLRTPSRAGERPLQPSFRASLGATGGGRVGQRLGRERRTDGA